MSKTNKQAKPVKERGQYGKRSSIVGICTNILLFATKFTVGTLFNSISITGDAVNNLSDAGSSVISLISFRMSGKPADKKHPFGHARIEYIASSIVAFIILMVGVELIKSSVNKIINPAAIEFSIVSVCVLVFSIGAKLWLCGFYTRTGKKIDSSVMRAAAADSLSDVMATSAVLLSTIISPLIGFQLDGYMGVAVAVFIMVSGIGIVKGTMDSLLGKEPSEELIKSIEKCIKDHEGVIGIHDLMVHDYGPGRCFASVHVEVDAKDDIMESHDLIDDIERDFARDLGIHLVIHLDPIVTDDPFVNEMYRMTAGMVSEVDGSLTIHDFRVVKGTTHSNLIFDIVVPYECKKSDGRILEELNGKIGEREEGLYLVVTLDRAYIPSSNHNFTNGRG
jgi:cation diffusion facilitator family transporter